MAAKFRIPLGKNDLGDPQQSRVYRMESEAIGARSYMRLDDEMIRYLTGGICKSYGLPRVKVEWADMKHAADYDAGVIRLSTRRGTSRNVTTVVHECAHHLHEVIGGEVAKLQQAHGSAFMTCYMHILDTVRVVPVYAMRLICQRYRVKFIEPGESGSVIKLKRAVLAGS